MKLASVQDTPNGLSATLEVINAGVMVYTSDSILTQGYADTRYAPIGGGGGGAKSMFSGTFLTSDGKVVTVVDGIVESIE